MLVRDYLLSTRSALSAVRAHVQHAFDAWSVDWLGQGRPERLSLECQPLADSRLQTAVGPWWESRGPWGYAWMRTDAVSELIGFVFGTGKIAADGMAAEAGDLAAQAWLALLTNASAPAVPVETLPAHATQPGQQSVHIEICAEDRALELVVQPAEAQGVTVVKSGDAPLGRLDRALAGQALRLQVILGEAEVDLGTLQDLAVGDILRLHCRLDQPAEVLLLGQKLGCTAYPGTLDGRAAVEIGR